MMPKQLQVRYVFAVFAFMGTFNLYALRLNLSVAIVDMVDFDNERSGNISNIGSYNETNMTITETTTVQDYPSEGNKFIWNENQQGLLLSAYFYGYMVTQVPGAYLGRIFGRVRVLGGCVVGSSTLTLLFPVVAKNLELGSVVAIRVLVGVLSGVTMPILFATTSAWAPLSERSKLISILFAGIPTGTCIILPVAGLLADAYGWESVFYATGLFGLLWAIPWLIFIYDSPQDHPRVSAVEKRLIMGSKDEMIQNKKHKRPVPWLSMITSGAWACLAFTHFSSLFGKYLLMTMLPSYLKTVLNFNVKASGVLSSIPFMLGALLLFVSGPLADCLIAKDIKSIYVRKSLTTIGLLTSSISISIVTYIGPSVPAAMTLFTLSVAMDSLVVPGFKACIMEITPEFSGIAYGLSNTVSTLSGIIAPQITGFLRQKYDEDPITGWRVSFWIGGAIYFLGAMVFLIFGTNKKQPWSYESGEGNEKGKEEELCELNPK